MKITKSYLKRIIKEELEEVNTFYSEIDNEQAEIEKALSIAESKGEHGIIEKFKEYYGKAVNKEKKRKALEFLFWHIYGDQENKSIDQMVHDIKTAMDNALGFTRGLSDVD